MKVLDFGLAKAMEPGGGFVAEHVDVPDDHHARDDAGGHDPRHGGLHVAGAGAREDGGQARRHLGVRRRAVRDAHGQRAHSPATTSPTRSSRSSARSRLAALPPPTTPASERAVLAAVSRRTRRRGCATSEKRALQIDDLSTDRANKLARAAQPRHEGPDGVRGAAPIVLALAAGALAAALATWGW